MADTTMTMEERGEELNSRGQKRSDSWSFSDEPSQTIQSQASEADIQNIMKRFGAGIVDNLNEAEGVFMDVSEFDDFGDVMRHAALAEVEFMKLPSKMREVFHHDVAEWLDTAFDDDKRAALVEAGIIEPEDVLVEDGPTGTPGPTEKPVPVEDGAGTKKGGSEGSE